MKILKERIIACKQEQQIDPSDTEDYIKFYQPKSYGWLGVVGYLVTALIGGGLYLWRGNILAAAILSMTFLFGILALGTYLDMREKGEHADFASVVTELKWFYIVHCIALIFLAINAIAAPQNTNIEQKFSYAPELVQFVENNTEDPQLYLERYDEVWGDLTREYGDIIFEALTADQRKLVHYPPLDTDCVYYVKSSKSYHSLDWCYTLLSSKEVFSATYAEAVSNHLLPCSKCVGDGE